MSHPNRTLTLGLTRGHCGDAGRILRVDGELQGDVGRCRGIQGDMGRHRDPARDGEISLRPDPTSTPTPTPTPSPTPTPNPTPTPTPNQASSHCMASGLAILGAGCARRRAAAAAGWWCKASRTGGWMTRYSWRPRPTARRRPRTNPNPDPDPDPNPNPNPNPGPHPHPHPNPSPNPSPTPTPHPNQALLGHAESTARYVALEVRWP